MRLEFTDEEQSFREEVRRFLREQLSRDISDKVLNGYELGREDHVQWQRRLHERGWGGMGWPVEFGGPGWNSVQQYIFEEESARIPFILRWPGHLPAGGRCDALVNLVDLLPTVLSAAGASRSAPASGSST